ncbi:MAG: hypothetical protein HUJ69_08830, partial [Lachnospiraceae bacterium]|nr:hypothetical protein [Lachnospiraceae bacterium]
MKQDQHMRHAGSPDLVLLIMVSVLVLFGCIMIGSANGWIYNPEAPELDSLMIKQFFGLMLGFSIIYILWKCNGTIFRSAAIP